MVLTLGMSQVVAAMLIALFLVVCVLLILIVLIQRPQGGGLSGAFGAGGGSGQTAFGAKTGDALTIATIGMFILYLVLAVGLQFAARPGSGPAPAAVTSAPSGTSGQSAPAPVDENAPAPSDVGEQTPPEAAPGEIPQPGLPIESPTGDQTQPTGDGSGESGDQTGG